MFTLGMENGDLAIDEKGQPTEIRGTEKLYQDIAEALNSQYDANKQFGGKLADLSVNSRKEAESEVYTILNRLMALQTKATAEEKIKYIRSVQTMQKDSSVYAYIEIVSFSDEKISGTFNVIGD